MACGTCLILWWTGSVSRTLWIVHCQFKVRRVPPQRSTWDVPTLNFFKFYWFVESNRIHDQLLVYNYKNNYTDWNANNGKEKITTNFIKVTCTRTYKFDAIVVDDSWGEEADTAYLATIMCLGADNKRQFSAWLRQNTRTMRPVRKIDHMLDCCFCMCCS